jgi:hypothetical protein
MKFSPDRNALIRHQQEKRREALVREADPLFFAWQADEGTREEWLAKRAEIKARYPYPPTPKQK